MSAAGEGAHQCDDRGRVRAWIRRVSPTDLSLYPPPLGAGVAKVMYHNISDRPRFVAGGDPVPPNRVPARHPPPPGRLSGRAPHHGRRAGDTAPVCLRLRGRPSAAQAPVTALCLVGRDADDRGYHIPVQADPLGGVEQAGLQLVDGCAGRRARPARLRRRARPRGRRSHCGPRRARRRSPGCHRSARPTRSRRAAGRAAACARSAARRSRALSTTTGSEGGRLPRGAREARRGRNARVARGAARVRRECARTLVFKHGRLRGHKSLS